MKKLLLAIAMTATMAPSALAYTTGYVDTPRVMQETRVYRQAQTQIRREEAAYQKALASHQKSLEEARKKNMKEQDLNKLREKYSRDLAASQQRIQRLTAELSKRAQATAIAAVKKIAAQKKLDLVLDKQAVLHGGVDITRDVIRQLNGK